MANYNLVVLAGTALFVRIDEDDNALFELHIRERNKPLVVIECRLPANSFFGTDIEGQSILVQGNIKGAVPSEGWDYLPRVDITQWEIL